MRVLTIGDVARRAGISVDTVRFYEREGLLPVPHRRPSGYREYDESVLARLTYIHATKELGFTLPEIRDLLRLSFGEQTACIHVRELAKKRMADIDEKLRLLRKMKRSLKRVVERCESDGESDCPLWAGDAS